MSINHVQATLKNLASFPDLYGLEENNGCWHLPGGGGDCQSLVSLRNSLSCERSGQEDPSSECQMDFCTEITKSNSQNRMKLLQQKQNMPHSRLLTAKSNLPNK